MSENKIVDNSLSEALGLPNEGVRVAGAVNPLSMFANSPYLLLTLQGQLLSNSYKSYGILQTVVDQPVMDAFAGDMTFTSSTLSPDEIDLLKTTMDDEGDFECARDVCRWQRLYGGGVMILNSQQKTEKPVNLAGLYGKKLKFIASDRWECQGDTNGSYSDKFTYYESVIDKSRVYCMIGKQAPYYLRLKLQGWGMSIYEQMLADIIRFFKAQNVALELLDEAKIDVLKIFDLATSLSTADGTRLIKRRIDIAANQKNYKSMLAIDSKDEYEQKQINLSGLAPLQQEIRVMMCASARMPEQKLYGIGSGGFSDDDGILETYNKMVKSEVRTPAKRMLLWCARMRCWQLFGREVPDLQIEFENLRELSKSEETDLNVKKGTYILQMRQMGLLTAQETMQALEKDGVFTMKTKAINGEMEDYAGARYGDLLGNDFTAGSR